MRARAGIAFNISVLGAESNGPIRKFRFRCGDILEVVITQCIVVAQMQSSGRVS
jgi:hypothetical protein